MHERENRLGPDPLWHTLGPEAVFEQMESRAEGLEEAEASRRLAEHGANRIPPPRRRGPLVRLLSQFHHVLIYVLLAAALVTTLLEHLVDAGVIIGVVIINGLIGFAQEGRAEKAIEAVRNMLSAQATVIREGRRYQLPAESLVPGDVVFVQSGDRVPADLRLFRFKELRIEEAILTGESAPVFNRAGLLGNPYVLMAVVTVIFFQLLFTYLPIMQHFFATTPIGSGAWLRILGVGILVFLAVEAEKALLRRRTERQW